MYIQNSIKVVFFITILGVSSTPLARADSWDPGDDSGAGATVLTINETVQEHGPHTTTSQTDVADWFAITLTAGVLYHFESTGDADMEAFLYSDSAGSSQVAYNDDKVPFDDPSFYIAYPPTISGTYYLKVKHLFNASSSYSLSYYEDPPSTDAWDPGDDSGAGATLLTIDESEQTNGVHLLSPVDLVDWFKFSLVAGNTYCLESTGTTDCQATLYSDEDGVIEVDSDDQSGTDDNFQIKYKPSASGDYYLKVETPTPGSYANYTLKYIIVEDLWDPGDDTGSGATTLIATESVQMHGPHTLSTNDLSDWFHINMVAGSTYHFESTVAAPDEQDTRGTLYSDSSGTAQVAIDDDSGEFDNFMIAYTPTVSGDYYLLVEELYDMPAGYWLKYRVVSATDTDGDGQSDADEAIAGTDPNDEFSYFAITNWSWGSFTVEWPAFSNRQYQVYRAATLTNIFNPVGPVILYPTNSYTDTENAAESSGFYKVEVQLQ